MCWSLSAAWATGRALTRHAVAFARRYWVEVAWSVFVVINVLAMLVLRDWATVPFHFIWIGLSLLYGWRIWSLGATSVALATVVALTGTALLGDVLYGGQTVDELTEVPLMAVVFVVMVMYVRRSVAAQENFRRVSEHNFTLLQQERQLIEDASHLLRTPLTIALGNAELIKRTTKDPDTARDSVVVIEELKRLKTISDRLLGLAATEQPDYVHLAETPVRGLVTDAYSRWLAACPALELGSIADVSVPLDSARFLDALDELIGNAVTHTLKGTPVLLSARLEESCLLVAVADRGPGISRSEQALIFNRFARIDGRGRRDSLGLGLAIVKGIAEAHGGSIAVRSDPGHGATFELRLPLAGPAPGRQLLGTGTSLARRAPGRRARVSTQPMEGPQQDHAGLL
jgi:signal transduction histidine kinase